MHIILAAAGHIGRAVTDTLQQAGEPLLAVVHTAEQRDDFRQRGIEAIACDMRDRAALAAVLAHGKRLFLLNPPASPATDTTLEETRSMHAMLDTVAEADLDLIVAESTYGAQPGKGAGDLSVLYDMEQRLAILRTPRTIIRGGYYFSNWDASLAAVRETGILSTFYPADFQLPMVSPRDIGGFAAELLMRPDIDGRQEILHFEGPQRYMSSDVAAAFASELGKDVQTQTIPREQWTTTLQSLGFSEAAARSFVGMTDTVLHMESPAHYDRGRTTLQEYIKALIADAAVMK